MDCSPPGPSVHGFPRQEYWSELPFPSPGDLANPGIDLHILNWQAFLFHWVTKETPTLIAYSSSTSGIHASQSIVLSSVTRSCLTLCNPMDCSIPGFPFPHQLPKFAQTHVHWVNDAIQPSHPLPSPPPPAFNLSQHQGLLKWVSSSHQVVRLLELQLQHQSFQWIFRSNFL